MEIERSGCTSDVLRDLYNNRRTSDVGGGTAGACFSIGQTVQRLFLQAPSLTPGRLP